MKKSIYLSMSILDIRKTVMYEYYYDYIKPKYEDNAKLCYMDAYNFIVHIKTKDVYKDIKVDVNHRFDTSNCITKMIIDHYLQENTKKKMIGPMADESGGKIMAIHVELRPKTYAYLTDDDICVIRQELMANDYTKCLGNHQIVLRSQ